MHMNIQCNSNSDYRGSHVRFTDPALAGGLGAPWALPGLPGAACRSGRRGGDRQPPGAQSGPGFIWAMLFFVSNHQDRGIDTRIIFLRRCNCLHKTLKETVPHTQFRELQKVALWPRIWALDQGPYPFLLPGLGVI